MNYTMLKSIRNPKMLILLLIVIICQMVQLDNEWDRLDGDDAQYIMHAQSLIVNGQYNDPNYLYQHGATNTPKSTLPGWPLLLVPLIFLFGKNLLLLKIVINLLVLISGILLFRISNQLFKIRGLGFIITAIFYFSMTTVVFSRIIYSEWPYLLISLLIIERFLDSSDSKGKWIMSGFLMGLIISIRSIGFTLLLAGVVIIIQNDIVIQKRLKRGLLKIAVILFVALSTRQTIFLITQPEKGPGYMEQIWAKDIRTLVDGKASIRDIAVRVPKNGLGFINAMGPMFFGRYSFDFFNSISKVFGPVINGFIFVVFLSGFCVDYVRRRSILEYYLIFYFSVLFLIWFRFEAFRYMMPVFGLLIFYFMTGFQTVFGKLIKIKKQRLITCGVLVLFLLFNLYNTYREIDYYKFSEKSSRIVFQPYKETIDWLKRNVEPGTVIVADDVRWYVLESGLLCTSFLRSRNVDAVYNYIQQFPKSIIVYDENRAIQRRLLRPVIQKYHKSFSLLEQIGHIFLFYHDTENQINLGRHSS